MSKHTLFLFSLVSFIIGVFINNYFINLNISFSILFFIVLFFLNLCLFSRKTYFYAIPFFIIFFLLGIFVSHKNLLQIEDKSQEIQKYFYTENNDISIEIEKIDSYTDYSKDYLVKLLKINGKDLKNDIAWIIEVPYNDAFSPWDILRFDSKIYPFKSFSWFDYEKYMFSKNIYFRAYPWSTSFISHKPKNKYIVFIETLRENIISSIHTLYPFEESIFLWGILLWARENMPQDLKNDFNNSGLTHLIAVSGFNITILIIFFSFFFSYFPSFLRIILISLFVIFFTFLVWYNPPVLRASIMGLLWFYALSFGRKASFESIFLLTIFIMTCVNPLALNYDISFQLSFFSVLWIVYLKDILDKIFAFVPSFFAIRESLVMSLSALIFTFPLIIVNFWQMSIISPLSNIIVAPTIPFAMFFWFLSIIFFPLSSILWQLIWYIAYIFLKFDITIIHLLWNLDFALYKIDFWYFSHYFLILYYLVLLLIILRKRIKF